MLIQAPILGSLRNGSQFTVPVRFAALMMVRFNSSHEIITQVGGLLRNMLATSVADDVALHLQQQIAPAVANHPWY